MDLMQPFFDWISAHPQWAGLIIFLMAAGESLVLVGLLVPGVFFMLGIGALVGFGLLDFWSCFFWAAAGAVAGDGFSYWLGKHYHNQLQASWPLSRYPNLIPRGEQFFRKHGRKSVFLGRFIGPLRAIIPAIAGIMEMPPLQFYIVNILSALFWAPIMLLPGIVFGTSMEAASGASTRIVIIFVVLAVVVWLIALIVKRLVAVICDSTSLTLQKMYSSLIVLVVLFASSVSVSVINKKNSIADKLSFNVAQIDEWWNGEWEKYPDVNSESMGSKGKAFTVQWLAKETEIIDLLQNMGWKKPVPLSYSNTFLWLDPDVRIDKQPVLPDYYFWNLPALTYLYRNRKTDQLWFMRLWTARDNAGQHEENLWFGYISKVNPGQWMGVVFYPDETFDDSGSIKLFMELLEGGSVNNQVTFKIVRRSFENEAVGDVLLINSYKQ